MIKLKINNKNIQIEDGTSVLEAAASVGFDIPSMCLNGEVEHFTSCMICIVKDVKNGSYIPSCTAKIFDGMEIITDDDEIANMRKTSLELLLSNHTGDCEAPCRIACPAFMNIPLMNRLISAGNTEKALQIVREDIVLPGVLGRICSAPCEKACKRASIDEAVSICLLKRFAYDNSKNLEVNKTQKKSDKKIAVIGAGPAGLSAAYYLQLNGINTVIFDENEKAGGALRYSVPDFKLDKSVLDIEIEIIKNSGVEIIQNTKIDKGGFVKLRKEFDYVVIACGNYSKELNDWGFSNNGKQILINKDNYSTNIDKVFAIGNVNRSSQQAIRSVAQGKEVAKIIREFLEGNKNIVKHRIFNSSTGRMLKEEFSEYMKEASADNRQSPEKSGEGFNNKAAQKEALRCLHCDCRKSDNCKLRNYSDVYKVSRKRFAYSEREPVKKVTEHKNIIYEPGKCIKCGICVRITAKYREEFGFTFIGRGFDVKISVPFNEKMDKALQKTAEIVAEACPTGALARNSRL